MIAEALAGRRIAITGTTGFLGTALLEKLMRAVPDCELVLLVRAGKRSSAAQRVQREILRNDAFDGLRAAWGKDGFTAECDRRIRVITGDVGADGLGLSPDDLATLAGCDIVIHSAATVSFDSPLDSAVEVNLLGPVRIAETLGALGSTAHLVAVSTCYVAGSRRGSAPEQLVQDGPFALDLDWRAEVRAARRVRDDADMASRTPERLAGFRAEARRELGAAGTPALAAKTEQRRVQWVRDQLVDAGRSRAASLGWPDAYTYTKCLGEGALTETANRLGVPFSIVRPSIIASSFAEPRPGWIRGFRMAEPVIISFARGLLKEFPGIPEGTVDVIPVDMVVNAICCVAALGPERAPKITQVASGSINPLKYRQLVDNVSGWFTEHPLYDEEGQPIVVPEWSFPGRGRVEGQLNRAKTLIERGERTLQALPLRGRQAEWSAKLEQRKGDIERALEYVELYGAYAVCEAIYDVTNLIAMHDALDVSDRDTFGFDPRVIDWPTYVRTVHLPSVVEHARVKTTPTRTRSNRAERLRAGVLDGRRQVAAFDLENTLISSNVVVSWAWLATRRLPPGDKARFVAKAIAEGPSLLALDRKDRGDFLRFFYRRYEDAPLAQIDEDTRELFSRLILMKSFPDGIRRVREHRAAGHRTVLITGALDFVVEPLRPLFDEIVAARLDVKPATSARPARYAGELLDTPPTGETRAQVLFDYCAANGFDPAECVAYADSSSDLPMLEAVGFPVAVNPETRLAAIARKRGWLVEHWAPSNGAPTPLLPIAPTKRPPFGRRPGRSRA